MTREEVLAFARQFDPQPFHIDEEAARRSIYGGIIASGWHTAAIAHGSSSRASCRPASMGSPGLDELRWLKPVRPGDALTLRIDVERHALPQQAGPRRAQVPAWRCATSTARW